MHGELSKVSKVQSGVQQGLVLGPLLFLAHIGNTDENLKHSNATFVNDTQVRKKRQEGDTIQLQQDLTSWAQENNMTLNKEKFEHLRYRNNKELPIENPDPTQAGILLPTMIPSHHP